MPTVRYTTVNSEVIAEKRGGVRRLYVPDPLGSTVALLDNTQAQTDTFTYWPYGEVRTRTGTTATPFQFVGTAGYYQDNSTITYVVTRYLNTLQTRWMTQEPVISFGGSVNVYVYASNNPITINIHFPKIDPCLVIIDPGDGEPIIGGRTCNTKSTTDKCNELCQDHGGVVQCCCRLVKFGCDNSVYLVAAICKDNTLQNDTVDINPDQSATCCPSMFQPEANSLRKGSTAYTRGARR